MVTPAKLSWYWGHLGTLATQQEQRRILPMRLHDGIASCSWQRYRHFLQDSHTASSRSAKGDPPRANESAAGATAGVQLPARLAPEQGSTVLALWFQDAERWRPAAVLSRALRSFAVQLPH